MVTPPDSANPGRNSASPQDSARSARQPASTAPPLPDASAGAPEVIWPAYFAQHTPPPRDVARHVEALHRAQQHEHVIWLIQSALINGQSQPWMYEVLALSMEIQGRPQADVDRVVMSLADFGTADFGTMAFSAAYLARLGRQSAALVIYRQASRLLPERPEPYVLGLRLARKLKDIDGIEWTAAGVLQYVWTRDYKSLHREAESAVAEALQMLRREGQNDRAEQLAARMQEARRRDLMVRLVWSGAGDLDLLIEEPTRTVCSFQNPETSGGGVLVHDGCGPTPQNCYEEYVNAEAWPGDYLVRIRHAWGTVVGERATLTIIRHQGTPEEKIETYPIQLRAEDVVVRFSLPEGRRKTLRDVVTQDATFEVPVTRNAAPSGRIKAAQAEAELNASRGQLEGVSVRRTGAVGFQPVIQVIPEGSTMTAQALVSPDLRYVRIGAAPTFSNVTDVFTFSFINGVNLGSLQPGLQPGN